jgi:hypothetical protein
MDSSATTCWSEEDKSSCSTYSIIGLDSDSNFPRGVVYLILCPVDSFCDLCNSTPLGVFMSALDLLLIINFLLTGVYSINS